MSLADLEERLRLLDQPSLEDLGGAKAVLEYSSALACNVKADRIAYAFAVTEAALAAPEVTFVANVLRENPYPYVVASVAQAVLTLNIEARDQRLLQRRLLDRVMERDGQSGAEMASECLAGAFLLADLPGASRPAVVAALDEIGPGDPPLLVRRAALLAGLAWLWNRSPDLEEILQRLSADKEAGEQAQYEMALISLDQALRDDTQQAVLLGLERAASQFASASLAGPELVEAEALAKILSAIVLFCSDDPEDLEALLLQAAEASSARGAELDRRSLRSWLRPRLDAEIAWWNMASALKGLSEDLGKRSWLRAVSVLEQIARLRRSLVPAATPSGDRLRGAITEKIAESFLREEGLRGHLTAWLEDALTSEADRSEASALLEAMGQLKRRRLAFKLELHPLGGADQISIGTQTEQRARALVAIAANRGFTEPIERAYVAMDRALAGHPDYAGVVQADARGLIEYLTLFLSHCLDVTPTMAKGLFDFLFARDDTQPLEIEVQRACWHFLRLQAGGFPQHQVLREVADIGSGRADIVIIRPEWRIVLEIKRELENASRDGIRKYLGQVATYELAGPRIAFLVVLDLVSQRGWPLTLEDNCWVESLQTIGDSQPRMVCVWRIPGARQPPSETLTPIQ
jgi:hypothetical protein